VSGQLQGRRIIVTGAASGMGAAIARLFAREGARLALLDISENALGAIAEETGQLAVPTDVSDERSVEAAVKGAIAAFGGLDGLVNAAGVLVKTPVVEMSTADFDKLISVNLRGPFLTCRTAIPHLQASGAGVIVNIASLAAVRPGAQLAVYSATKAGLLALSEALVGELGPDVRINVISPGLIRTAMTEYIWKGRNDDEVSLNRQIRRPGEPEEIAETALFLMSRQSSYVSGANLVVSGGHLG
jgi:NAD(P)-dependent dehydrogenase (short-subunit alcohol dehydrogenase family)